MAGKLFELLFVFILSAVAAVLFAFIYFSRFQATARPISVRFPKLA